VANVLAVHSVGASLATYLRNSYPSDLRVQHPCDFRLVSSSDLVGTPEFGTTLSLYLFRVTQNEHLRNIPRRNDPLDGAAPLAVDLHYLMTVWADSALAEHTILAWAMRQLHALPVLDVSSLSPEAGWTPADFVQVIPAELSHEELMRIWEALDPPYRLSVSYIARVVRIDLDTAPASLPVVATRLTFTDREAAP
jgi:uncharacterized protein DUF4255